MINGLNLLENCLSKLWFKSPRVNELIKFLKQYIHFTTCIVVAKQEPWSHPINHPHINSLADMLIPGLQCTGFAMPIFYEHKWQLLPPGCVNCLDWLPWTTACFVIRFISKGYVLTLFERMLICINYNWNNVELHFWNVYQTSAFC